MFENICTLPVDLDIISLALHPSEPLLTVGLSNGLVECFRLPPRLTNKDLDILADESSPPDGKAMIVSVWRTRRHKGSCRCLAYSPGGEVLYSAGSDGIVKQFSSATGIVQSKMAIPLHKKRIDAPTILQVLNPQKLVLACDSGAQHIVDLKNWELSPKPTLTTLPHDDYVSCVVPLPPSNESTSGYPRQWISTGATTLVVTDAQSGIMARSEDQGEELLCASLVPGLGPKNNRKNAMIAVGSGSGVISLWDRGAWDDQFDRIIVDSGRGGGESIDVMALVPAKLSRGKKLLVVGLGDGTLRIVDVPEREVLDAELSLRHDGVEGVIVGLEFDSVGRLITAGGNSVKIWQVTGCGQGEDEGSDEKEAAEEHVENENGKRPAASDSDGDDDGDSDDYTERRKSQKKKRKGSKKGSKDPYGHHGILKFDGLE